MPPTRKRQSRRSRNNPSNAEVVAPGGGTQADVDQLAKNLGLESDAVSDILNCEGSGVTSSRSSRSSGGVTSNAVPVKSSAWADFMNDDEDGSGEAGGAAKRAKIDPQDVSTSTPSVSGGGAGESKTRTGSKQENVKSSSGTSSKKTGSKEYVLPILTKMKPPSASSSDKDDDKYITPGILAQTGSLDSKMIGRTKRPLVEPCDLQEPTVLAFDSIFEGQHVAFIATSSTSTHSIAILTDGTVYSWGRNETGQCGLGYTSPCVPLPVKINLSGKFVGAAVGKNHSILIDEKGTIYAVGGNKYGQCGVNTSTDAISAWKKCSFHGKPDNVTIVQASCGECFSVLLDSTGVMYTAGLAEYGQLGNGETGEYFIAANKIGFANATKFERQSTFVHKLVESSILSSEEAKKPPVPLPDTESIRIGSISCGKNHTVAVEAPLKDPSQGPRRVFTWGHGGFGVLGQGIQADEYSPRLVSALTSPLFKNNSPIRAEAGAHCSLVLTENGHVYYFGKHRSVGESTMRPALVDVLANNGHVVSAFAGGAQTVYCSTQNGVTVSWGNGQMGELGYGISKPKSSSKPKFVEKLDKVLISDVSCGYGHTLLIIRNEDEEDKKLVEKIAKIEKDDLAAFVKKWSN